MSFEGQVSLRASGCLWTQILHSLLIHFAEVVMLSPAKHLAKSKARLSWAQILRCWLRMALRIGSRLVKTFSPDDFPYVSRKKWGVGLVRQSRAVTQQAHLGKTADLSRTFLVFPDIFDREFILIVISTDPR